MILNTNTKLINTSSRALLCSNTSFNIIKRFTGNDKLPAVARAISKQCIGLACPETRPLIPSSTPSSINNNNLQSSHADQAPQEVSNVDQSFRNNHTEQNVLSRDLDTVTAQAQNLISSKKADNNNDDSQNTSYNQKQAPLEKDNNLSGIKEALTTPLQGDSSQENLTVKMMGALSKIESNHFMTNKEPYKHPNSLEPAFQEHQEKLSQSLDQITHKKQEQDEFTGDTEHNLTPSKFLNTINNKSYTTPITQDTTPDKLTPNDVVNEWLIRQLSCTDKKNVNNILLSDNSLVNINQTVNNTKITPNGQAYCELYSAQKTLGDDLISNPLEDPENIVIIAPPKIPENILLENSKAKHLMFGCYTSNKDFVAFGYLTSKKSGNKLSDTQYIICEQINEGNITIADVENTNLKAQYYMKYKQPTVIKKDDVRVVKYSVEYLETINIEDLQDVVSENMGKKRVTYEDTCGITKDEGLEICKMHDKIAEGILKNPKTNRKHPISAAIKKQNEENNNILKNKDKQTNNINEY